MSIRKILYKSFDSILTEKENKILKERLSSSKKLLEEKLKMETLRVSLATYRTRKFNPEFETNLLNKIRLANYPQIFLYKEIQFAFRRFVFAAIVVIASLVLFNFEEHGEIKILGKENVKLGEAINSEYFYLAEILKGDYNVE